MYPDPGTRTRKAATCFSTCAMPWELGPLNPQPIPAGGGGRRSEHPFLICPDAWLPWHGATRTHWKLRGRTPAPGLCRPRTWWLHLGLGRRRTDSTRAAPGVPQAWTAERRQWEWVVGPQLLPNEGCPDISIHVCPYMSQTFVPIMKATYV